MEIAIIINTTFSSTINIRILKNHLVNKINLKIKNPRISTREILNIYNILKVVYKLFKIFIKL